MRGVLTAVVAATVVLAGCSAAPPVAELTPSPSLSPGEFIVPDELLADVEVSDDCLEQMRSSNREIQPGEVEALFQAILDACTTPQEWVSAYRIVDTEVEHRPNRKTNEFGALVVTCLNAIEMGIESATCDAVKDAGWLENLPPNDTTDPLPLPSDQQ